MKRTHARAGMIVVSFLALVAGAIHATGSAPGSPAQERTFASGGPGGYAPVVVAGRIEAGGEVFRILRLAEGLEYPWSLAFLPGGGYLVAERPGRLLRLEPDGTRAVVSGLPPVRASGQGGLLDLALHPDFGRTGLVYWTYAAPGPGGASTALARGRLEGTTLSDVRVLWTMGRRTNPGVHFGSRIRFGADGMLYLATGDRGEQGRARDPGDAAGKVLRLAPDGTAPADNPFRGRPGHLPELYSLGHRNIQGLALRPGDGRLWATEHGPRGGDEVNLLGPGLDYGWPLTTYGVAYSGARIAESPLAPGIEPPRHQWTPSIAPSGLDFYAGGAFPSWRGGLLSGSLAGRRLVLLRLRGDSIVSEATILDGTLGRIRDVRTGPDGLVYLLTDEARGGLYRLEPAYDAP